MKAEGMAEPRLGADAACWQGEGGGRDHSWQSVTLKESAGAGGGPTGRLEGRPVSCSRPAPSPRPALRFP